jgi:hypothetical protein
MARARSCPGAAPGRRSAPACPSCLPPRAPAAGRGPAGRPWPRAARPWPPASSRALSGRPAPTPGCRWTTCAALPSQSAPWRRSSTRSELGREQLLRPMMRCRLAAAGRFGWPQPDAAYPWPAAPAPAWPAAHAAAAARNSHPRPAQHNPRAPPARPARPPAPHAPCPPQPRHRLHLCGPRVLRQHPLIRGQDAAGARLQRAAAQQGAPPPPPPHPSLARRLAGPAALGALGAGVRAVEPASAGGAWAARAGAGAGGRQRAAAPGACSGPRGALGLGPCSRPLPPTPATNPCHPPCAPPFRPCLWWAS